MKGERKSMVSVQVLLLLLLFFSILTERRKNWFDVYVIHTTFMCSFLNFILYYRFVSVGFVVVVERIQVAPRKWGQTMKRKIKGPSLDSKLSDMHIKEESKKKQFRENYSLVRWDIQMDIRFIHIIQIRSCTSQ